MPRILGSYRQISAMGKVTKKEPIWLCCDGRIRVRVNNQTSYCLLSTLNPSLSEVYHNVIKSYRYPIKMKR
jgi:hypothetical protein